MAAHTAANISSILSDQTWSSNTVLSIPGSTQFSNATSRWNVYRAPTYAAALSIGSEDDLVTAVKLATANNIPFLATGGRNGYGSTLANLQQGLALDLSPLDSLSIDAAEGILTVGPGVLIGDVYDPVYNAGYQFPTGVCSCAGLIGITLGAGIGRLQGTYGLTLDALQSARVVTASGEVLEASASSNPDLFWAIRGTGQNFGIVTSATYKLHPLTQTFTSVDLVFPGHLNDSFFNVLATFDLSAKWAIVAQIFYDANVGETAIRASCVYHGPRDEALPLLEPILSLGPVYTDITELPWNRLNAVAGFSGDAATCEPGSIHNIYGVNLRKRSASTWTSVFEMMSMLYQSTPGARTSILTFEAWGNQAVAAVPDEETAYPWRDAEVYVMGDFTWTPGDDSAREQSISAGIKVRETLAATSGYDGLAVYVNYARGDESLVQRYGETKLPKLVELKRKYDPHNVFRFHHPLPMEYP
ncbi:hypothetical protein BDW62DRAFT_220572 [Aspergillus aurantiobrunneus]